MLSSLSPIEIALIFGTVGFLCVMPFVILGWTMMAGKTEKPGT
jgi:hypothetical protein